MEQIKDRQIPASERSAFIWVFNLPAASHMGGIWERMIRTVCKVFNAIRLKNQSPNDKELSTMMCEVEAILNSGPLTKVSDDPNDLQALSPNHLTPFAC